MRFKPIFIIVFLLLVAVFVYNFTVKSKNDPIGRVIAKPAHTQDSAHDIKNTIVTPHLEQKIIPGKNVIWCSTFQLAWNELFDFAKGPIKLIPASVTADILNRRTATKADIDSADYVAKAGFVEDGIIDQIRNELSKKFNGRETPELLNQTAPPVGYFAYAYFEKSLPFRYQFGRYSDERMKFQDKPVQVFGITQYLPEDSDEKRVAGQVSILDDKSEDDFIIELKTVESDNRLILAKIPPAGTLQQTIKSVMDRVKKGKSAGMTEAQYLYIPVIDFNVLREYGELTNHRMQTANSRLNNQPIAVALQSIRFKLDETGAVIHSEGAIAGCIGANILFDKPFLVMMQRKNAKMPYFALWVGNTELLIPT